MLNLPRNGARRAVATTSEACHPNPHMNERLLPLVATKMSEGKVTKLSANKKEVKFKAGWSFLEFDGGVPLTSTAQVPVQLPGLELVAVRS